MNYFDIDYVESSYSPLLVSNCPIHMGDNPTAFNINIDEENEDHYGRWFCNTHGCHNEKPGKDALSFVWLMLERTSGKDITFMEALKFCEKFCQDVSVSDSCSFYRKDAIDKLGKIKFKQNTQHGDRESVRSKLQIPSQYFITQRGFKAETLDMFDVGVCNDSNSEMYSRVVFPVYDDKDICVGYVGRTTSDHPQKWKNSKGFSKANFLYNYSKALEHIKRSKTIILVEGQGDVMRLWEAGICNVVGLFGSKMSDAQEFLIQKSGALNIVLMTDSDEAGGKCKQDIKERTKTLFNIIDVNIPCNDIGDMSVEEVNKIIKPQIEGKF